MAETGPTTEQPQSTAWTQDAVDRLLEGVQQRREQLTAQRGPRLHLPDLRGLSRIPREITGFRVPLTGRSVGDLAKEALVSGSLGALFRIGLSTGGIGGYGLAIAAGGGVSGIREHFKKVNETWASMRQEQGIEGVRKLGKGDTLKGFFNPDQKKSIAGAIARGAVFGLGGGIVGGWLASPVSSEAPVIGGIKQTAGDAFHDVGTRIHEQTGIGIQRPPMIDKSKYFTADVEIRSDSPQWIKTINNLDPDHGIYAKTVQGTVGEYLPGMEQQANDLAYELANQKNLDRSLSASDLFIIRNHVQHILEDKANQAFDSHLQNLVNKGIDLNTISDEQFEGMIKKAGREAFEAWLEGDAVKDIKMGIGDVISAESQIEQYLGNTPNAFDVVQIPKGKSAFEVLYPGVNVEDIDALRKEVPSMVAHIATNHEALISDSGISIRWEEDVINKRIDPLPSPFPYFEAYFGELNYLMLLIQKGDVMAIFRLRDALKHIMIYDNATIRKLHPDAVGTILKLLEQVK